MKKKIILACMLWLCAISLVACGKSDQDGEAEEEQTTDINGIVDGPEDFESLGMIIDVADDVKVSDKTYEIVDDEIAKVYFVYNGLECEFRASAVYSKYDLAGVENTALKTSILTTIDGNAAEYYTLVPGRVAFWEADNINYCLYVYVTASDDVTFEIVDLLSYESKYSSRADVIEAAENAGYEFAKEIVKVVQAKDLDALADMMYYPQQLASGESVANAAELLQLDPDDVFTEKLLAEITETSLENYRESNYSDNYYVIGSTYQNIYFQLQEDGTYKIMKFNN